jgi:hypothetical protein
LKRKPVQRSFYGNPADTVLRLSENETIGMCLPIGDGDGTWLGW